MNANKTCFHAHVRLRSTVSSLQTYKMGATVKTESDEFSVSQQKIINSLQISTSSTAESHSYHCNVYYLVLGTQNLENAPPHSKLLAPIPSCGTCHYCPASHTSAYQWNALPRLFGEFLRHGQTVSHQRMQNFIEMILHSWYERFPHRWCKSYLSGLRHATLHPCPSRQARLRSEQRRAARLTAAGSSLVPLFCCLRWSCGICSWTDVADVDELHTTDHLNSF